METSTYTRKPTKIQNMSTDAKNSRQQATSGSRKATQEGRHTIAVGGATALPPEALDPWEVKERVAVEIGALSGRRLRWRPEEIGAPHMKGFLFDPSGE